MQCGELAQAFAQCVKRSSDLGICANERGGTSVAIEMYRMSTVSTVGNRMKSKINGWTQSVLRCNLAMIIQYGGQSLLSATLGLPNPLPGGRFSVWIYHPQPVSFS